MRIRCFVVFCIVLLGLAFHASIVRAADAVDTDNDGLSDVDEIRFKTDPGVADTDGDGYADGLEIRNAYDPRDPRPVKIAKRITINRAAQQLSYSVGVYTIGEFRVSTGKPRTPTPKGTYQITAKRPRTWSSNAQLWMPWWLNFTGKGAPTGRYAIHELPEWPGGKKEGADHLGKPVSGGCVRLGVGSAKKVYDWAEIGTKVVIQ